MSDNIAATPAYPPRIVREDRDPENQSNGSSMLWFQETNLNSDLYLELRTLIIRGRRTLPRARFFAQHDVVALETAAEFTPPMSGNRFKRRVLIRPKYCNVISMLGFGHLLHPRYLIPSKVDQTPLR